jgi:CHAT domain-containing protein
MPHLLLPSLLLAAVLPARTLHVGDTLQDRPDGGTTQNFEVVMNVGEYVEVALESGNVELTLHLSDPDGHVVEQYCDGVPTTRILSWVATTAGVHQLELRAQTAPGTPAPYGLRLVALRPATDEDRTRARGLQAEYRAHQRRVQREKGHESLLAAVTDYEEARRAYASLGDAGGAARMLRFAAMAQGGFDEARAIETFKQVLEEPEEGNERAFTLNELAQVYIHKQDDQAALSRLQEALVLAQKGGFTALEGAILANLGALYLGLKEGQTALRYFQQSLPLLNSRRNEAIITTQMGECYSILKDWDRAAAEFERMLAYWREEKYWEGEAYTLMRLGHVEGQRGRTEKAASYLRDAAALQSKAGNTRFEVQALYEIALLYRDAHDYDASMKQAEEGLARLATIGNKGREALEWEILTLMAETKREQGDLHAALTSAEAAVAVVDAAGATLTSDALRTSHATFVYDVYSVYLDILMRLHQAEPDRGWDRQAFEVSERGRARSLVTTLRAAKVDLADADDAALLAQRDALSQRLNAKADLQLRLVHERHDRHEDEELRSEIQRLLTEQEDLQAKIRQANPRYGSIAESRAIGIAEIQAQLGSDTLVLEYALGRSNSYLWVITADSFHGYRLPARDAIEPLARRAHELLIARNAMPANLSARERLARVSAAANEYDDVARRLADLLLSPVPALSAKRFLIVPDGALQYVSFAALPAPARSPRAGKSTPLLYEHEVVYAPSMSVLPLLQANTPSQAKPAKSLAVFADPVFDKLDPRVTGTVPRAANPKPPHGATLSALSSENIDALREGNTMGGLALPRLEYTRELSRAVMKGMTSADVLRAVDFEASRRNVLRPELADYRTVVFATHALVHSEYPELSGIALSMVDEKGAPQDGFLRLHDVYNLRLNADLVVLGACETGLGREMRGEGLIGLSRGFLHAGARRVLASLWKVDEEATVALLSELYRQIGLGRPYSTALREAQMHVRRQARWQSPYYWAGFVLQGS